MDVVTTSLDALLQRATNPQNPNVDSSAVEAFCALANKEKDGTIIGAKLIATRIHSQNEREALHALCTLDTCMKRCNASFNAEIGKFRFLNEMIKLVSPKYLGSQTPLAIKQKVLQLFYIWTIDFPKEVKIKEAYDMLKKQGVIREVPLSVSADNAGVLDKKTGNSVLQDEEKNRLLQKLLQSKNPEDLQAANRLIKNMVKEEDKRAELKSRRITELESVHNNVRLLNEMLDSYKPGVSSSDELELIRELYQSCERLRPNVFKLAGETQQNEEMLNEVLQASEELGQVFDKYGEIIIKGNIPVNKPDTKDLQQSTLLDFATSIAENTKVPNADETSAGKQAQSDIDLLCDIFTSSNIPETSVLQDAGILKPAVLNDEFLSDGNGSSDKVNKLKALDELDALGEHLLKQNLTTSSRLGPQFNKIPEKISMNVLAKQLQYNHQCDAAGNLGDVLSLDLNYLVEKPNKVEPPASNRNSDDVLVDITEEKRESLQSPETVVEENVIPAKILNQSNLKLSDILVKLEDIRPSLVPPLTVLDEKNCITVTLHFGKNKPREDVAVVVVTTISKNEQPMRDFLFQAVVPKGCKLKLQPPSATELPAYNPFLPPSAITQIMLIANPQNMNVSLKFIVSYTMEDETITELGEVERLPVF